MRRRLLAVPIVAVLAAALYLVVLRDETVAAKVQLLAPTALIGSGEEAVGVGPRGEILDWQPPPDEEALPRLPLAVPPDSGRLGGTVLEQARVLGAAPPALRPYLGGSSYGESGVDIELRSGIELRFGDASRVEEKWQAAVAVLADESVTTLDYVNLQAPRRPALGGSGHTLPPIP